MKGFRLVCTASNSNRSSPACSPILRKRSRSPTPQQSEGEVMVEKSSDHSSDKSPPTPEPGVQRSGSSQSGRSGGKNSKVRAASVSSYHWTLMILEMENAWTKGFIRTFSCREVNMVTRKTKIYQGQLVNLSFWFANSFCIQ
ncbi:hypothetical protein GDO81_023416 [Engystomops pustulosus]|uniref:Uncharacterized protein n=1 Tax=Engystomops pustulosus TaxID=76066 RepID=A0AAV6Z2U4_ENGPU|nr:hypothetical protein GDO81_023416 [Engystomops pustulosus]